MKDQEKELFKALCKFKTDEFSSELLNYASPTVLGYLFYNRMQGVAYDVLRKKNYLGMVNREFRNSLGAAYEHNKQKNHSFFRCVDMVSRLLLKAECKTAMLKGAYLCAHYPEGYRTSNDIDILVAPNYVTTIGELLLSVGFEQGNVRNGEFVRATRREIIESKMMRGETVPYIKHVDLPFMKYLELDINFSLDYKPGDTEALDEMLLNSDVRFENGIHIPTLDDADFFIHLCAHLYKEATTLPWIEMKRDMALYKYCDIYMLLEEMSEKDLVVMFSRAEDLGMEKICAYCIMETIDMFDMDVEGIQRLAKRYLIDTPDFCLRVYDPKNKKEYRYKTNSATERFFMQNRINDLMEV